MSLLDNFTQFHFLRPFWLFGLLLLPVFFVAIRKRALTNSDWSNAIAPELLQHLLPSQQQQQKQNQHFGMVLVLACSFIAMSGPTWQEKPQEVVKLSDNMVIILDLSLSMLATDVAPNRLTRTKQKLQDLLKLRKEGNTALIAFSGDSHIVTPLTDDTKTIIANLPALDPFIMPVIGSRPDLAVKQALQLLKQGNASNGRIILLTDGVENHQIERINDTLESSNTTLLVLSAGTSIGGPIPLPDKSFLKDGDSVVIPKTDFTALASLAKQNHGKMVRMTLDDQDLNQLDIQGNLSLQNQADQNTRALEKGFDAWEDMGFLLILLIIPFVLRAHRQGVIIQLGLISFLVLNPVEEAYAFGWDDLWQTQDQQAQTLLKQGKSVEAAEQFSSAEHKANAHYQAKQFEQAANQFAQADLVNSHTNNLYNQGNALAQQQKFEDAIKAYDEALKLDPDNEDASHNKKLIEEFLKQQSDSSKDQNSDEKSENKDQDKQDQKNQEQQSDQQNKDQSEQSSDQKDKQNAENEQQSDQQDQNKSEQKQEQENQDKAQSEQQEQAKPEQDPKQEEKASALPKPAELSEEEKQSYEQWMRRVPDDPGGLLRRKFEQQSRDRNRQAREAGEPIW